MKDESIMDCIILQRTLLILQKYTSISEEQRLDEMPIEQIGLDRLEWLEFVFDIEEVFEIEFPAKYWTNGFINEFKTVGNMIAIIEELDSEKKTKVA